jgi:hypothetical protein
MRRFNIFNTFLMTPPLRSGLRWTVLTLVLPLLLCGTQVLQAQGASETAPLSRSASSPAASPAEQPATPTSLAGGVGAWMTRLDFSAEAVKLWATWIIGGPALVIAAILILLMRPLRRKKAPEVIPTLPAPTPGPASVSRERRPASTSSADAMEGLSDKQRVLRFFFQLFKNQIGAGPNLPSELFLVETRPTCPDETYEMRILQEGEWTTRRMSIGLLGQGGGSRSKCFYVIYDSHMVVKIPAAPITGFTAYNRQIGAENAIVARLAPRECIVPRVSVILKNVYALPESDTLTADVLEKKYKHALEVNPFLQEYLKIGSSFAFFMDLAKHFFLSTTLDELHRGQINLLEEALLHPELLWDHNGFVCRYGEEAAGVCHAIQEVFCRAEKDLQALVAASKIVDDVPLFQLKRWFLIHMAGERIDAQREEYPAILIDKINQRLQSVIKQARPEVQHYRNALEGYIQETRFSRHRTMLESLATNTLDLLVWLRARGLALRDLKPENLFVAGNPDEYPYFLNDPQKFSIGLIDVETAVPIHSADNAKIPQPQLAGTPLYATPSHLISNAVLTEIYGDLRTLLHLQDWYAAIAIIFKIFTGKHLFIHTARVFPEIINRLKVLDPAGPELEADVRAISRLFWNSATAEFQEALSRHEAILTRVEIQVPADFAPEIIKTMHHDCRRIQQTIYQSVSEQQFFASEKKRCYLLEASADKIGQMKNRLAQESTARGEQPSHREAVLTFFQQLERLKHYHQNKLEAAAALKTTAAPIAADQLLESMFQHVASFMYLPSWPALKPSKWRGVTNLPTDIATYQATI